MISHMPMQQTPDGEAGAVTTVGLRPPFAVAPASASIGGWSMGMCVVILPRPQV